MRTTVGLCASFLLMGLGAGCTALVEGTLSGRGGDAGGGGIDVGPHDAGPLPDTGPMLDGGPASPCSGMPNGLHCLVAGIDEPFICLDGICQLTRCGDGVTDPRTGSMHTVEACDDGNAIAGDGCEGDCTFSCTMPSQCDDGELCNGSESCSAMHTCAPGTNATDLTPCTIAGSIGVTTCHMGVCRAGACPDGHVDSGEDCDPAVPMPNDGCNDDCTFTCVADSDCDDGNLCNGNEVCNTTAHTCSPAAAVLTCDDSDMCTTDTCDMTMGCVFTSRLVDADGDGFYAPLAGCGSAPPDCDDADPNRYPGAPELCGGTVDNNCDGFVGMPPNWYRDCDGDHFAAAGATAMPSCTMPAPVTGCMSWTQTAPTTLHVNQDCLDTSAGPAVHPGQTAYYTTTPSGLVPPYDYDCNGVATHQWPVFSNTLAPNPPSPLPRGFVTCHVAGTLIQACVGDSFWRQTTLPACGASGTQAYCAYYRDFLTGTTTCQYVNHTVLAACH